MKHSGYESFLTDSGSEEFCDEIVADMVRLHGITRDEAIGRVNRHWAGMELIGPDDLIYHEDPEYWANTIYYGKDSFWWMEGAELSPLPYP